jgi:hypothetical protein
MKLFTHFVNNIYSFLNEFLILIYNEFAQIFFFMPRKRYRLSYLI